MNNIKVKKNFILILQKGFSLIELLVVIAIIGILAGIGIFGYNSYVDYAKQKTNEANAKLLANLMTAEITAQRGKLKSACPQTLSRDAQATDWTWSNCVENLIRSNAMINPYTNRMYGSYPADPYGFGTWTFTLMWGEGVNDNTYAAGDDYFICGACSDDVGGLATVYSVSESDWNPSTEQYNKYKAFISTCSVTKYDEQDPYTWSSFSHKFFAIRE